MERAAPVPWKDPQLALALVTGPIAWGLLALSPGAATGPPLSVTDWLGVTLVYPVLEELVFRGLLQPWLARMLGFRRLGPVSAANLLTSVLFAAAHLMHHPGIWAAAVLGPSLVFGHFRERHAGVSVPIFLHAYYNAGYFLLAR